MSETEIRLIPLEHVDRLWPDVVPLLLRGEEHWIDFYDLKDIKALVKQGLFQLWLARDEGGPYICALTEVRQYPKISVLRFIFIGGADFPAVHGALDLIELWASRLGCRRVEVYGRRAWERLLKSDGYGFGGITLVRDISDLKEH